ncbi:helix-turn-helix transcriptional regulator [Veillonella sp. VA139]|uniref:helix-turn-helix domain-containing protein n=1 Tax=Veillonella sp. VA139 TaxID=741830 RepID=UPI000F8E976A|nr:helix-turn-helix transcriptional regulator [Veillonella sp. VA139]
MKFNYNGLRKLLIDNNMKKKDLIDRASISLTTLAKMAKGEAVSLSILGKICKELNSDIGDLICLDKER